MEIRLIRLGLRAKRFGTSSYTPGTAKFSTKGKAGPVPVGPARLNVQGWSFQVQ
jgi:hypothetical protein